MLLGKESELRTNSTAWRKDKCKNRVGIKCKRHRNTVDSKSMRGKLSPLLSKLLRGDPRSTPTDSSLTWLCVHTLFSCTQAGENMSWSHS